MYCKNCGKEIQEDQLYCKYCGTKNYEERFQEETGAPERTTNGGNKFKVWIPVIIVLVLAAVFSYFQFFKTTSIDLANNMEVKFTGTDGSGYAEIVSNTIDYDKTDSNQREFISVEGIESFGNYQIQPGQGTLKTGDKVTVSVPFSEKTAQGYHVKVTNNTKTFIVGSGDLQKVSTPVSITVRPKARTFAEDCVFPDSSRTYLTDEDAAAMSSANLRIARNEIYARHGRLFDSSDLQNYFNTCSWYYGYIEPSDFDEGTLSSIEKANIRLFQKYE